MMGSSNVKNLTSEDNITNVHLYLWTTLMLVIFTCGAAGNTLTIVSIFVSKKLQTHSNILVINMAVIDLLLSAVIYPTKVISMLIYRAEKEHSDIFWHNFCRYYGFFSVALSFSSNMTSCMVAVNRFIAIVYAQKYYNMQKTVVLLLMVSIPWLVPAAISSLGLMNRFGNESFHMSQLGFCTFNLNLSDSASGNGSSSSAQNHKFIFVIGIPGVIIPTVLIALSYFAIYLKVWNVRRNLRNSTYLPMLIKNSELSVIRYGKPPGILCLRIKRFEHRVRGARMMFICACSYCLTYWPATIVVIVSLSLKSTFLLERPPILLWFFGLYFTGCCINPIIYAWMNVDFRKAFKRILCLCCNRASNEAKFSPRTLRKQIPSNAAHPAIEQVHD